MTIGSDVKLFEVPSVDEHWIRCLPDYLIFTVSFISFFQTQNYSFNKPGLISTCSEQQNRVQNIYGILDGVTIRPFSPVLPFAPGISIGARPALQSLYLTVNSGTLLLGWPQCLSNFAVVHVIHKYHRFC